MSVHRPFGDAETLGDPGYPDLFFCEGDRLQHVDRKVHRTDPSRAFVGHAFKALLCSRTRNIINDIKTESNLASSGGAPIICAIMGHFDRRSLGKTVDSPGGCPLENVAS